MYELERKTDPTYPFSEALVFCPVHNPDSDVYDVDKCEACSKPGKLQCGQVVSVSSWRTPRTAKVVVIRTYKHGEGFLGLDVHTDIGAVILAAVQHNSIPSLDKGIIEKSYEAAKHYYESEIRGTKLSTPSEASQSK